ncbi:MAG TPA: exosortase/archaeosortase family protein [Clostridia bacterium]|nr:exosortase/archaeosortase family protein [Clostridia bacterium]
MDTNNGNGILEEFRLEFLAVWHRLPNKAFFFGLLAAWLVLFHFLGNSTLGYVVTHSLFEWMYSAYTAGGQDLVEAEDAYALMIPVVVIGLMWWKRKELLAVEIKPWWPALILVAGGLSLHVLGYVVQQQRISIVGLFTGIYGLMGLAWGFGWLRASFFPFFLFAFCVPLGSLSEPITFRLRLLVSQLVEFICHFFLAIDVVREGTGLKDPTGRYQYEVAAACSGIRSLISTFAFAVVLAFVSLGAWWKRFAMIASAVPLAVLGNLLRMLSIVIAAELGGQDAGKWVHDGGPGGVFSLMPYIPAFIGLLLLERYLSAREPRPPRGSIRSHQAGEPSEKLGAPTESVSTGV